MCYDLAAKYWYIIFHAGILQSILGYYPCYFLIIQVPYPILIKQYGITLDNKGGLYHEGATHIRNRAS